MTLNEISTSSASAIVSPMAVNRTFHQGRLSSMSYARSGLPTIATRAAELLHMGTQGSKGENASTVCIRHSPELLLEEREDFRRRNRLQSSNDRIDEVGQRKEAREGETEQHRWKKCEEEVAGELSRKTETVVFTPVFRALKQLAPTHRDLERGEHTPVAAIRLPVARPSVSRYRTYHVVNRARWISNAARRLRNLPFAQTVRIVRVLLAGRRLQCCEDCLS